MNDKLLKTIETLYDCIDETFDHARGIEAYSKALDDTGLLLSEIGPGGHGLSNHYYRNFPEDAVGAMVAKFDSADNNSIFQVTLKFPVGTPILRRVFVPDAAHLTGRMYNDSAKRWGIHSEGASILTRDRLTAMMCAFIRHPGQRELDHEMLGMMAVLNNHYRRAMGVQGRLDQLEQTLIQSSNLLDLIDFGVVLYGKQANPVFVNAAAQRIIDQKDGVALNERKLFFLESNADQAFQDMVSALYRQDVPLSAKVGGALKVARISGEKAYGAMLVPVPTRRDIGADSAAAAVFLFDPLANRTAAIDLFVSNYDLSRAEAKLAHRLALGDSLEEAAARRSITRNTAKGQLRSIFAKTNTNRQPELVSLLLRSIAGINLKTGEGGRLEEETVA